jgi:hypothetical protein
MDTQNYQYTDELEVDIEEHINEPKFSPPSEATDEFNFEQTPDGEYYAETPYGDEDLGSSDYDFKSPETEDGSDDEEEKKVNDNILVKVP